MVAAHSVELQSVAIQTELLASSSEAKPLYKDHTPSFMEVAINTSSAETEDSATLQKHLEAARITTELLQACLEDSQHKVATLQASEASLSREVENKEARIASLTKQMKDMITRLEVRCHISASPAFDLPSLYSPLRPQTASYTCIANSTTSQYIAVTRSGTSWTSFRGCLTR